jgi:hypothetical protein
MVMVSETGSSVSKIILHTLFTPSKCSQIFVGAIAASKSAAFLVETSKFTLAQTICTSCIGRSSYCVETRLELDQKSIPSSGKVSQGS